jgi:hypothetical protein
MNGVSMLLLNRAALREGRTNILNGPFTMHPRVWSPGQASAMGRSMAKRTPMAGGFLWMAAILVGTVWGVAAGNPMKGVLAGTAGGAAMAIAVWLLDRRSSRRRR